jgi:FAD:protein FMN transferase
VRRARPLLGTFVEIEATAPGDPSLERAVNAAFEAVTRVHRLMSFHDPLSDLARLNRYAPFQTVSVDRWTGKVLRQAGMLFDATSGLFDCAVGRELMQRGLLPSEGLAYAESGTFSAVEHLGGNQFRYSAPIAIDLGGIAKGFAVDRAVATLRAHGVREALVNAGGDIRVIGPSARPILIRCPGGEDRVVRAGLLRNAAIATSSAVATVARCDAAGPTPAAPNKDRCAYSVVAPTCLLADALTKVLVQLRDPNARIFAALGATAFITSDDAVEGKAA